MSFPSTIRSKILALRLSRLQKKTTGRTKQAQSSPASRRILILTGSIGSGHVSVACAIAEAIQREHRNAVDVETVDFVAALANFATSATKKIYLGSLKLSPKIWELLFAHSTDRVWPVKLLNVLTAPFLQRKFLNLMREKQPTVIVSTFPIWDILIKKTLKQYGGKRKIPFVSVVTDSISIHGAWAMGNPDFFVVPNEDTKVSLVHLGVPAERIKLFGYPIAHRFFSQPSHRDFYKELRLSHHRKTLLLILSIGVRWAKVKQITGALQRSSLKNIQLIVIAAGDDPSWEKKLKRMRWPFPARVTGWTYDIHRFIHASDIVLTKAGGATVMECIHTKKPMIIVETIPGQEVGNALLVQKYNLGVVTAPDLSNLDDAVRYILHNETLIKKNLAALQTPRAAEDIARFLIHLAKPSR